MAVVLLSEFPFAPRRFLIPTSCATMFETRNSRAAIIVVRMVLEQEEQVLLLLITTVGSYKIPLGAALSRQRQVGG